MAQRSTAAKVQCHLGKVFTKLAINSRSQLDRVLPSEPTTAQAEWLTSGRHRRQAVTGHLDLTSLGAQ